MAADAGEDVNMTPRYPFTTTDLLRTIENLKCAIGTQGGLLMNDYKTGRYTKDRWQTLNDMQLILYCLEQYNPFYYAQTSINCLTIDEMGVLIQKANSLMELCACNNLVRAVTIPNFYY